MLAFRKALHLLAYTGTQQQDLRRAPAQFQDPAFRQSGRGHSAPLRDESDSHLDGTRCLLSPPGGPFGKAIAITATARKLAVIVYRVLSSNLVYNDPGPTAYHQLRNARELKSLRKRARLLGFHLVDQITGEVTA